MIDDSTTFYASAHSRLKDDGNAISNWLSGAATSLSRGALRSKSVMAA